MQVHEEGSPLAAPESPRKSELESGLERLRRTRSQFWLGFLGWIVVNVVVVRVIARFDESGLATTVITGLATVGLAFLLGRAVFARCPRCGETFAVSGMWGNFFTKRCLHCGQGID
jgi:hypothetical protein